MFGSWNWISNNSCGTRGTRIIICWDPNRVNLMVLKQSDQVIHCQGNITDKRSFFCSFVYASNHHVHRRELWSSLCTHKHFVSNIPWAVLGDFNVGLNMEDHSRGSSSVSIGMREFRDYVEKIGLEDLNRYGLHFTWNQRPHACSGILKKLDRVMINGSFLPKFSNASAEFLPYRISDHTPYVLKFPAQIVRKPKPFRLANFVTRNPKFHKMVANAWKTGKHGSKMFVVVTKM